MLTTPWWPVACTASARACCSCTRQVAAAAAAAGQAVVCKYQGLLSAWRQGLFLYEASAQSCVCMRFGTTGAFRLLPPGPAVPQCT